MAETDRLGIDGWAALGSMTQIPHSWWAPLIRWFPRDSHLCEYGCGAGNTAFALAQASLRYKFSLMDFSKELLQQAWQKFQMLGGPYQVDYWCFDALETPPENFPKTIDIAYSVGLLEHFSDSEIVQILKNQSQIARSVCAIVPNAHCITYQSWKKQKEDTGTWEYGHEDPKNLEQMKAYFDQAGLDVIAHMTMGDNFIDDGTDERYLLAVLGNVR